MQAGQLILVRTNPATQFRATLAQNAALTLNLTMPPAGSVAGDGFVDAGLAAGSTVRGRLKAIGLISVENLAWEVWLWSRDLYQAGVLLSGTLAPLGRWSFVTGDGARIAATGAYYYYKEGLDVAYEDLDRTGEVHLMLVNRSASGKSADDAGAVQVQLAFEPTYGI